ncbi:MAG: hypothetical protein ABIJ57_13130, partial [Pseudomonadota bacterium]
MGNLHKVLIACVAFVALASFLTAAQSGTVTAAWGSISWTTDTVGRQWNFVSTVGTPTGGSSVGVDGIVKTLTGANVAWMYAVGGSGTQFVPRIHDFSVPFDSYPEGLHIWVRYQSGGVTQTFQNGYTDPAPAKSPQTIVITPSKATQKLIPGETIQFTANGSASGEYVWDYENGQITIQGNGESILFRAGVTGQPAEISCYAPETDTHLQSNTANATYAVVSGAHKVNVRLPANDTGAEIRVLISQNGEPIEERLIPVGATAQIFTVVVPTADPVLVTAQSRNVAYTENGIWTVVPDAVGDSKSTEVDPFADWDDDDDPDKP